MRDYTDVALNVAEMAGAEFADIRIVNELQSAVYVERMSLKFIDERERSGYGVRVLIGGAWGFASGTVLTKDEVGKTARRAVEIARASGIVRNNSGIVLTREKPEEGIFKEPCDEDPFRVTFRERGELLLEASRRMLGVSGIVATYGFLQFIRLHRIIANSDGSYLDMTNFFANPALKAVAVMGDESQERSYQGGAAQGGYEFIRKVDLLGNAERWAKEAVEKCRAEESPSGVMDLVLDPMNLALTMHESVGHPTELDRILGWEANMAGRSFIKPVDIGRLRYGSELVNFTVDNTLEGGLGSWFYDDDGVRMKKFPLIKDGILVDVLTSRETAPLIDREHSGGCCRADAFNHFPITRIPNLYMGPGIDEGVTPEDLIAGVEKGVLIEGMGSFSIDQMRNNFQFGGDMFWLIEKGRKTKPLKKVTYRSDTRRFWGSCDGIAGRRFWRSHGVMNCGKGEPLQVMYMTHGASWARFRNISVGEARL
jgi:TldD protein